MISLLLSLHLLSLFLLFFLIISHHFFHQKKIKEGITGHLALGHLFHWMGSFPRKNKIRGKEKAGFSLWHWFFTRRLFPSSGWRELFSSVRTTQHSGIAYYFFCKKIKHHDGKWREWRDEEKPSVFTINAYLIFLFCYSPSKDVL